jgi:hypothetical protein
MLSKADLTVALLVMSSSARNWAVAALRDSSMLGLITLET